jgi:hypothetical protein
LDDLARHHNVTFDINEEAFKRDGIRNVGSIKVAETPIPKMANTRLSEVLPMILAQVPAPSGATFFIHFDAIEITTRKEVTCSYLDEIRYRMKIITSLADPFDPPVKDVCSLIAEIAEWKAALTDRVRPIAMRKDAESLTK